MGNRPEGTAVGVVRASGGAARRAGERVPAGVAGAVLVACTILPLVGGGCGASKFTRISETAADFEKHVIEADMPVLVEFFKGGCATCWLLEPTLDQLADEYTGQLRFISFEMMRSYFAVSCPELQKRHRIAYYPTVVLFDKGEEKKRWILDFSIDSYRKVLNELVGAPTPKEPEAASSADQQAKVAPPSSL